VDWNESSLIARFRGGLKDEILDSIATVESNLRDFMSGWLWLLALTICYGHGIKIDVT
jgi:hypothetical protein